ncbi:hypothetical protein HY409_00680 [Candidatus Gottesmanbacteria bacterium]|nr:hypothetical protein [Candidatus Gottesmanbacteria bacterium]
MSLGIKFEKATREPTGTRSDRLTKPIKDKEIPPVFLEPAPGKFTDIEKVLADTYSIKIPDGWNVSNVLAALAVGAALLTENEKVRFTPENPPDVSLIIDDYHMRNGAFALVSYSVTINNRDYVGDIYIPGHPI